MDIVISAIAHRTGSTLVQRIFNRRERTLVWGEHGGALTHMAAGFAEAERFCRKGEKEKRAYLDSADKSAAWTARMSPSTAHLEAAVTASVRAFLDAFYRELRQEKDLVGFKEVRYGRGELDLVRAAYPEARIVLLLRDPVDVWRSMPEWGRSLEELIADYNRRAVEYAELSERPGFFLLRYEDVVTKAPEALALLSELARLTPAQITEVVDGKRLRSTRHEVRAEDVERIREHCAGAMERLGYAVDSVTSNGAGVQNPPPPPPLPPPPPPGKRLFTTLL